jgi:hypothetical protein
VSSVEALGEELLGRPGLYRQMRAVDRPAEDEHHRRAEVSPPSGPSAPPTVA